VLGNVDSTCCGLWWPSCCLWWGRILNRSPQQKCSRTCDPMSANHALQLHYNACSVDHQWRRWSSAVDACQSQHLLQAIGTVPLNKHCTHDAQNLKVDQLPLRQLSCNLRRLVCGLRHLSLVCTISHGIYNISHRVCTISDGVYNHCITCIRHGITCIHHLQRQSHHKVNYIVYHHAASESLGGRKSGHSMFVMIW